MAFKLAELFVDISIDSEKFHNGLKTVRSSLDAFEGQIRTIRNVAGAMLAGGTVGMAMFIKEASDAEEILNKFGAVFKDLSPQAEAFATNLSEKLGGSKTEVMGFLASMQDILVPMGLARKEAAKLSEQIVSLGFDRASFDNLDLADAMGRLKSAIIGNHDAVQPMGIALNEASLKMEGITSSSTNAEKALARFNVIVKGSEDAIGDAERTAGSFANTWKSLNSQFGEVATQVGDAFLPMATDLVKVMRDVLIPTAQFVKDNQALVKWVGLGALAFTGIVTAMATAALAVRQLSVAYEALAIAALKAQVAQGQHAGMLSTASTGQLRNAKTGAFIGGYLQSSGRSSADIFW